MRNLFSPLLSDDLAQRMLTSELTYETATGLALLVMASFAIFIFGEIRASRRVSSPSSVQTFARELADAPRYHQWVASVIAPFLGQEVLEIGSGLGSVAREIPPRRRYVLSDVDPRCVTAVQSLVDSRPYLTARVLDITHAVDDQAEPYDTIICLNVLEHIHDDIAALGHMFQMLRPGGRVVVLVPQHPRLYGSFDAASEHQRRYTRATLAAGLARAGFTGGQYRDFNRAAVPGWWLNSCVLQRQHFGRWQVRVVNQCAGLLRRLDGILPWPGLSLLAVAYRPTTPEQGCGTG